ncbi:hypothetical protein BKA65DRAFT_266436 [Rhexocercosporidium sp. MPI-PUGE-AT-0058]|nr:hypothetical protein BKA65DRAFT_266436 [Rhexocercosporidium sp. MPI-PUGE-AT-0058]
MGKGWKERLGRCLLNSSIFGFISSSIFQLIVIVIIRPSSYTYPYPTIQTSFPRMVSPNGNGPNRASVVGPGHPSHRHGSRIISINNGPGPESELNSFTPRPRARPLDHNRTNALLDLLSAPCPPIDPETRRANELLHARLTMSNFPCKAILKIRHSTSNKPQSIPLGILTAAELTDICARALAPDPIEQIYYWTPRYQCWTEARASGSLKLMRDDVRDMKKVHVYILRKRTACFSAAETVADLPFMRIDGFLLGDMVPVEGRRGRKLLMV